LPITAKGGSQVQTARSFPGDHEATRFTAAALETLERHHQLSNEEYTECPELELKSSRKCALNCPMKAIDLKIAAESREEADDYAEVGKAAASLAKTTNSTADGILVARMFPRQGGPAR